MANPEGQIEKRPSSDGRKREKRGSVEEKRGIVATSSTEELGLTGSAIREERKGKGRDVSDSIELRFPSLPPSLPPSSPLPSYNHSLTHPSTHSHSYTHSLHLPSFIHHESDCKCEGDATRRHQRCQCWSSKLSGG